MGTNDYTSGKNCEGATIAWRNLSVYVHDDKSKQIRIKCIINNVNGVIKSGTLVSILGASGCGKTTLMTTLANRKAKKVIIEGDIVINGYPIGNFMHYLSGFMHQEDLFISSLTVAEHLNIMAQLKLDRRLTTSERLIKIQNIVQQLGLTSCLNCKIGEMTDNDKTLSGGERKRLSFATELLTNPPLLFCDEPTTGLDSFSANKIVSLMNIMASQGKTIICTIHQPSSEIFALFNQLILMTNGRIAYQGSTKRALEFFQGLGYACPDAYNPADFFIKTLSVTDSNMAADRQKNKKICDYFIVSEYAEDLEYVINHEFELRHSLQNGNLKKDKDFKEIFVWSKFNLLMYRNLLQVVRDPTIQLFRIGQKIAIALMVGLCYYRTNILSQHGIQSVQGLIFIFVVENTFSPMYSVLSLFPHEFPLFLREYRSGLYSSRLYYLTKSVALLPGLIIEPTLFVLIGYWLAGLKQTKEAILYTLLITILTMNISTACGCLFSNLFGSVPTALAFLVPFDYVLFITSGTFIKTSTLSTLFGWIKYLSWLLYATESMSILQWNEIDVINCDTINDEIPCLKNGTEVLQRYNFSSNHFYFDLIFMVVSYFVFHSLSYLFFWIKIKES